MKKSILIIFYSRTGTTKKLAEFLSRELKADIDEVIDLKNRKGPLGYVIAGKDATLKKETKIRINKSPEKHDLILIGTPVWAWTITPAIRTYLIQNKESLKRKKLAFFCSMGGSGDKKALKEMEKISHKPICCLALKTGEVIKGDFKNKTREFLKKVY